MVGKKASLSIRFALWTSAVIVGAILLLASTVYYISSRTQTAQADKELDRIVSNTAEALDQWIGSVEAEPTRISTKLIA